MDWIIIVVMMVVMRVSAEGPPFFPSPFACNICKVEAGSVLGCVAECPCVCAHGCVTWVLCRWVCECDLPGPVTCYKAFLQTSRKTAH